MVSATGLFMPYVGGGGRFLSGGRYTGAYMKQIPNKIMVLGIEHIHIPKVMIIHLQT